MKIKIFLLLLSSMFLINGYSQDDKEKISAGWGTLNYAVPEAPAFKILDVTPSNLLRPTSTRKLAFAVGNYYLNNGAAIPQNLTVEFSPMLFNPNVNLKNYAANRFWYTSALSIGTKVNEDKSYAVSVGLKFKLIDHADLRNDKLLNAFISKMLSPITIQFTKAVEQYARDNNMNFVDVNAIIADTASAKYEATMKGIREIMDEHVDISKISAFREKIKKDNWNKMVWDLGFASVFNSKDSLIKNLSAASKLGGWSTLGLPVFGKNGQLLLGVNGQLKDSGTNKLNVGLVGLGTRLYYGSNDTKGFLEAEFNAQTHQLPYYRLSIGIEGTFLDGLWINFGLGVKKEAGKKAEFNPTINFLFGNGERK